MVTPKNRARPWFGLFAAILLMSSGSIRGASWREIDEGLPSAIAGASGLAIDPTSPSTLYSWGSNGALFKSVDGAGSWNIVGGVGGVSWLVIDPKNSSTVYAGTSRGLVKSANGGTSWIALNTGPDAFLLAPVVVAPEDSNKLYAVGLNTVIYAGLILKSTDGGASWNTLAGSQDLPPFKFLTVDPLTPSTLYAVGVSFGGIFKSTDGGGSWFSIKSGQGMGGPEFVMALAIDPETPSTIYAAANVLGPGPNSSQAIIYKSTDGGQNWSVLGASIPAGVSIASLTIDAGSPARIYATYNGDRSVVVDAAGIANATDSTDWGVIKSTDGGETWIVMNAGLPSGHFTVSPLVIDSGSPETLYVGHVDRSGTGIGGTFKSTDGATTWNTANTGRKLIDIRLLAPEPVNADTIYAAVSTSGLFKSVDGGGNWTQLAAPQLPASAFFSGQSYVRSLVIDSFRRDTLYAVTARIDGASSADRLVFKSTDGGLTWSDSSSPPSCCYSPAALVMDPTDSNRLYLGSSYLEADGYAWLKSSDGGASWSNLGCCDGKTLTIDPANPATLYGGASSGLMKSTNGGASWSNTGLNADVNVLALDPTNTSIIYAATEAGLFKSTDGGVSWAPINDGLASLMADRSPVTALVIDPADPQALYAGTSGYGVFQTSDGGAHWSPFNDGLTNLDVRFLVQEHRGSTLYAGTGSGIFGISPGPETTRPFRIRR